jgi:hypothetical protein
MTDPTYQDLLDRIASLQQDIAEYRRLVTRLIAALREARG